MFGSFFNKVKSGVNYVKRNWSWQQFGILFVTVGVGGASKIVLSSDEKNLKNNESPALKNNHEKLRFTNSGYGSTSLISQNIFKGDMVKSEGIFRYENRTLNAISYTHKKVPDTIVTFVKENGNYTDPIVTKFIDLHEIRQNFTNYLLENPEVAPLYGYRVNNRRIETLFLDAEDATEIVELMVNDACYKIDKLEYAIGLRNVKPTPPNPYPSKGLGFGCLSHLTETHFKMVKIEKHPHAQKIIWALRNRGILTYHNNEFLIEMLKKEVRTGDKAQVVKFLNDFRKIITESGTKLVKFIHMSSKFSRGGGIFGLVLWIALSLPKKSYSELHKELFGKGIIFEWDSNIMSSCKHLGYNPGRLEVLSSNIFGDFDKYDKYEVNDDGTVSVKNENGLYSEDDLRINLRDISGLDQSRRSLNINYFTQNPAKLFEKNLMFKIPQFIDSELEQEILDFVSMLRSKQSTIKKIFKIKGIFIIIGASLCCFSSSIIALLISRKVLRALTKTMEHDLDAEFNISEDLETDTDGEETSSSSSAESEDSETDTGMESEETDLSSTASSEYYTEPETSDTESEETVSIKLDPY